MRRQVLGTDKGLGGSDTAHFENEELLDRRGRVSVHDDTVRLEEIGDKGQGGFDRLRSKLRPERHDVFDGRSLEHGHGVDLSGVLQLGKDVLTSKVSQIDEGVGFGDPMLLSFSLGSK